ncbi:hypothetical protein C7M61_003881 [Candidozyma pseudohaemuli]|uniref:Thioredoxin domain-containing protein n=1 Tax=Candidozyma pseudohaemuli TaxID=418784 RepID=A0A2P7YKB4_9ASCO|nr:hypothetical protein C7M61_003881 [[Candida] pseudohaemulonii]PSK36411.1 hypothetical protein C7M61_003881 [[Candida] pseudohaemulonii]
MRLSLLACVPLLASAIASPAAIKPDSEGKKSEAEKSENQDTTGEAPDANAEVKMPELLTIETFDEFTSKHLSFIEFFSPYCHHCQALAPKWEQTFKETVESQQSSGIHMRQVNCVESGDLCEREIVSYYPNLRVYVPELNAEGEHTGKAKIVDSFPRALKQNPENFKKFMKKTAAEFGDGSGSMPSSSQLLDTDTTLKIVAGEMEEPWFIGMFSSTDEEWESGKFSRTCMDCLRIKSDWDRLSNLIVSSTKAGHLNCKSNPALCEKLGFPELSSDLRQSPKYAMFLPKHTGIIRFDYNRGMDIDAMKRWIQKLALNCQYEIATAGHFEDLDLFVTEKPAKPLDISLPLDPRVALIFAFDKKKITKEDKDILPHLLEMVTSLPFNIRLYGSGSVKFEETLEYQSKGLVDFIRTDEDLKDVQYNRPLHIATTLTNKPTLYMFKENSMVPTVFQNYAPEDMRNPEKLEAWVMKNMYPLFQELTPEYIEWYFNVKDQMNDKIVVTFVDSDKEDQFKEILYDISLVAHEYLFLKKEYYFQLLTEERSAKWDRINALKEKGAEPLEVINAMKAEVPHLFDHDDALFVYIDLKAHPGLAKYVGWDIDGEGYKPGDSIVVTKNTKYYWDRSLQGEKLTVEPAKLRPVLLHLLDTQLTKGIKISGFTRKLAASPFTSWFRTLDSVYQHGPLGVIFLLIGFYVLYKIAMRFIRRSKIGLKGRGIIGNVTEKHD